MKKQLSVVPFERIATVIHFFRGQKVMLDRDLAKLYGVPTKALKQAVRRNPRRFPADFMFELTLAEFNNWRSQFVTSKADRLGLRHAPMAFTEQGVAMLSSVLNSQQAIEVNIAIMRAFVRLRDFLASQTKLGRKLQEMERKVESHHESIHVLFEAIQQLTSERPPAIGFHIDSNSIAESKPSKKVKFPAASRGALWRSQTELRRSQRQPGFAKAATPWSPCHSSPWQATGHSGEGE